VRRSGSGLLLILALIVFHPPSRSLAATAIAISISPTSVPLFETQNRRFTATVTGTTNTKVTWSISPSVGTIDTTGLYTPPALISAAQNVTVTATSAADTTKSAHATVNLIYVSVAVSPAKATVNATQTQQFNATVSGVGSGGVTWKLKPASGTIDSNGLYTPPAVISTAQTVTVTATSTADTAKSASATITQQALAVGVSVSPTTTTLQASGTQQFNAAVTGTSNTTVNWTLNPATGAGTIINGLYTAPAFIASPQTVTVTATSAADSKKSSSVQVTLQPTVAVSVSPGGVSLQALGTQQFTTTVTGTSNTGVTWSLSPNTGTISSLGLYTAPPTVSAWQQVIVIATSTADTTKSGQGTVTLNPPAGSGPLTMPVEVMGPNGTIVSAVVNAPTVPTGSNTMQMRVHGVKYDTEASVQVNGSAWVPLNTATVTLLGNAAAYGGIGGGFSTLDMTVPLPSGAIVAGNNTINFRFNATDGRTSGFRVLSFNFLDPNGNALVPAAAFVEDDPTAWQPPFSDQTNIAAGQALWSGAALTVPQSTGPVAIQATCSSCHTQDGRDLKYFNYSNNSIVVRSEFHGLTAVQGQQIASYIRTLNVNNPGRPWNPPYQPGPGLDALPVNEWAAGAGLDAVGSSDQDTFNDIFPAGIQSSVFSTQGTLNPRQIRNTFQLMDWNEWLPSVHPLDAFGAAFVNSSYNTTYLALRANLKVGDPVTYSSPTVENLFAVFGEGRQSFWGSIDAQANTPGFWTAYTTSALYSANLWGLVKSWELNNEFQLEGLSQAFYGPQASPRAWAGNFPFMVSPNITGIPPTFLKNGKQVTHDYVAFMWYHLQLVLNDSNKTQAASNPIDWPYGYMMISDMATMVGPTTALQYEWEIRGSQINNNGKGPDQPYIGWQYWIPNPYWLITPASNTFIGESQTTRIALSEGFLTAFLANVNQFTPQQFYTQGVAATPTQVPNPGLGNVLGSTNQWIDAMWYSIPQFRYLGVNQTLINQLAAWAQTVWPLANWSATTTATCSIQGPYPVCSTE
jgi:hypothetical protein